MTVGFRSRVTMGYRRTNGRVVVLLACMSLAFSLRCPAQEVELYELVLRNGRVVDPESGRDERANIGIRAGKIAAIATTPLRGDRQIDVSGLVVAPGFIDILGGVRFTREAHIQKVTDGVTTSMGMHGGPLDVKGYQERMSSMGPLVNYAKTVGHPQLRNAVGAIDRYKPATVEQIRRMKELARRTIRAGAAGIGFGINYTPGASYEEIFALFEVAAAEGVPCHLHARYKGNIFPETMSLATQEVIAMAAATGAQAQVAHLISSTVGSAPLCIKLLAGAAGHGVDVAFDFHVWTRNETTLQSALYDPGWEERFGGISYSQIYVSDTQERLTKDRFEELRAAPRDTRIQTEFIPESEIELALRSPVGMVSSDGGGLVNGAGHPRSVGTFARLLGRYVRERKVLSLMEALRKITLKPALRLEKSIPRMKKKGRLQSGCDADLTVFDPHTVRARATYAEPFRHSAGIEYVLVNGTLVVDRGKVVVNVAPGQWLRHPAP
ncbi:MAG: amidohydrolase family protein [Acidobacteriota bacterium]